MANEGSSTPRLKGAARSAFGQQSDSRKASLPIHNFSDSTDRDAASKVFISNRHHDVSSKGKLAPLGAYKVPGAIEKQVEAQKRTAPSFSFSCLDRMVEVTPSTAVPGPGTYQNPGAFGEQAMSNRVTGSRCRIGSSERGHADKLYQSNNMMTNQLGNAGAPPGTYAVPAALGKQVSSTKRTSPAFSLPHPTKLQTDYEKLAQALPPPGQYETWLSIGRQPLSQHKTAAAVGFGKFSGWTDEQARYLGLAHARTLLGTQSPAHYDHQQPQNLTSFGRQALSSRQSPPTTTFGTTVKMAPFKLSDTPGPGHYDG